MNDNDPEKNKLKDGKNDQKHIPSEDLEFGGTFGAIGLIIFSHWVLYYFWYAFEVNNGNLIIPGIEQFTPICSYNNQTQSCDFIKTFIRKGIPGCWVWINYTIFFIGQIGLAYFIPGRVVQGLEITAGDKIRCNSCPEVGKRLDYFCNGYAQNLGN